MLKNMEGMGWTRLWDQAVRNKRQSSGEYGPSWAEETFEIRKRNRQLWTRHGSRFKGTYLSTIYFKKRQVPYMRFSRTRLYGWLIKCIGGSTITKVVKKPHYWRKIRQHWICIVVGLSGFEPESPAPQAGRIPSYPTDPFYKRLGL